MAQKITAIYFIRQRLSVDKEENNAAIMQCFIYFPHPQRFRTVKLGITKCGSVDQQQVSLYNFVSFTDIYL